VSITVFPTSEAGSTAMLVLSPSAAGLSSTINDQEDYFRFGFTFISYIRVDYNIDLLTPFLKT
jgi:hypothetical protein